MTDARQAGFTLTEALVSLLVFALIGAACVAMLGQSVQVQSRVGDAQEALRALQVARSLLVADVAQIAPRVVRASSSGRGSSFAGVGSAAPEMSFVRSVGERDAPDRISSSLVAVEYALDDEGRLIRRVRSALDAGPAARTIERVLVPGATDVHFEFHDGLRWRQDWPNSVPVAPRAVAIIATLPRYGSVRLQALTGLS